MVGGRPTAGARGRDDNAALGGASSARRRSTDRARRGAARTATAAAAHDGNDKRRRRSATTLAGGEGTPAAKGRRGVWDRRAATVRVFTLTAHGQAGMGRHGPRPTGPSRPTGLAEPLSISSNFAIRPLDIYIFICLKNI